MERIEKRTVNAFGITMSMPVHFESVIVRSEAKMNNKQQFFMLSLLSKVRFIFGLQQEQKDSRA